MKVILTIGSPHSGYEAVSHMLNQAGLASAQAASKAGLSPQALQTQLLRHHEVDLSAPAPLEQVQPGKLWNELATDLFLSNMQQPNWGWTDPQSAVLMDFWRQIDSQVRLLLVYNSPANHLAQVLTQDTQPMAQTVATALDDWVRWNTALLRYVHRHPDYCLLVNSQQATAQPQLLLGAIAGQWQISELQACAAGAVSQPDYQHLQAHLINQLIDSNHPARALHQELEGSAVTIPAEPDAEISAAEDISASRAWADWSRLRESLTQLADENSILIADSEELTRARAQLASQLAAETNAKSESQTRLDQAAKDKATFAQQRDSLQREKAQLSQQLEQLEPQLAKAVKASSEAAKSSYEATKARAELAEYKQENELLLLQLHQVQEELEHYFLRHQELEKSQQSKATEFVSDFWRMHQPPELRIDMQHDIAGSNWYPAESDGRWAGPSTLSTLQMPPVQPGNYTLELDIVDAMNLGIVNELVIEVLGRSLPVEVSYPLYKGEYPLVCTVQLAIAPDAAQQPWQIGLRFKDTVCPADNGSDDQRNLAVRLRSIKLAKQA